MWFSLVCQSIEAEIVCLHRNLNANFRLNISSNHFHCFFTEFYFKRVNKTDKKRFFVGFEQVLPSLHKFFLSLCGLPLISIDSKVSSVNVILALFGQLRARGVSWNCLDREKKKFYLEAAAKPNYLLPACQLRTGSQCRQMIRVNTRMNPK